MKQDLEQFLSGAPETGRWLLIDSSAYLPLLCQHFPEASITAVTRLEEVPVLSEFADFNVDWIHRIQDLGLRSNDGAASDGISCRFFGVG